MAYVKKTQASLGKLVTKPPLTDKLLSKPPFRFLHDIISVLIRDKGIFEGLFTEDEMVSDNVKDKDSKIRYLEKALDCISFSLGGPPLTAKPGKIVSGQDAEKTNEFLQALAKLVETKTDTTEAVQKVLAGEKPSSKTGAATTNNNKSPSKQNNNSKGSKNNNNNNNSPPKANGTSSRRNSVKDGDKNDKNKDKISHRERSTSRDARDKSKGPSSRDDSRTRSNSSSRRNSDSMNGRPIQVIQEDQNGDGLDDESDLKVANLNPINEQSQEDSLPPANQMELEPEPEVTNGNGHHFIENLHDEEPESRPETSSSRKGNNSAGSTRPITGYGRKSSAVPIPEPEPEQEENRFDTNATDLPVLGNGFGLLESPTEPREMSTSSRQQSTRPGSAIKSARPRTGRLKTARPPSARPAAPRLKEKTEIMAEEILQTRPQTGKVSNVIIAGDDDKDEDEDDFLVEEKPKDDLDLKTETLAPDNETMAALAEGGQEHGALVQQILETQKELEDVNKRQQQQKGQVEIERESGMTDLSQRRERETTQREVDKLKESIQTLTRSANPLGKLMDFLQEDVDSMERELELWRSENKDLKLKLKHEEKITEKSIEPLKAHLIDLETAVQEQLDKISVVKANILRNEERISRMISTIGVGSK